MKDINHHINMLNQLLIIKYLNMNLLKKGMLFLFAATLFVACSDDDDVVVTPETPEEPVNSHPLAGTTWALAQQAAALGVGPNKGDIGWWSNSADDLTARACLFDDTITFNADNSYVHVMGSETWIESWQDGADEGCRAPIAPHDGSNPATWSADASTVTVVGDGAHIGLSKVHGSGEDGNAVDDTIVYNYVLSEDGNTMTVDIQYALPDGNTWTFIYSKQ